MSEYQVVERIPTVDEYNRIRQEAGLRIKNPEAVKRGLPRSLFSICIEYQGNTVGIGRVIGDGGLCFDLVDIAVIPDHQGKGLGKTIMDSLMNYVRTNALPSAFVALMTEAKMISFYEKYGFAVRGPDRPGMYQLMN
jgi:GNAT superfamily N-acetyltransferase